MPAMLRTNIDYSSCPTVYVNRPPPSAATPETDEPTLRPPVVRRLGRSGVVQHRVQAPPRPQPERGQKRLAAAGVIAYLRDLLLQGEPRTTREYAALLAGRFPDRSPEGLLATTHCQLSRVNGNGVRVIREFGEGRVYRYHAECVPDASAVA